MITTILAIAFLLAICVFFHELGHFLAGKLVGVEPKIFSIGYGRGVFFKKKGKTIYQITAIPLGGYVQFYGDDITKDHKKIRKGDFFSVGPWKRIVIAFAGPFFSILLGFVIIFFLMLSGWRPSTNKISLYNDSKDLPAYIAGLKNGDRVVEVNGVKTEYFEKANLYIALAAKHNIHLKVERDGKLLDIHVNAVSFDSGEPLHIGIQPQGEKYLTVSQGKYFGKSYIKEGDRILSANGKKIDNITALTTILNKNVGKNIDLKVEREEDGLFSPNGKKQITIVAPVKKYQFLRFTHVKDLQTEKTVPDIEIGQWSPKSIRNFYVNDKSYSDWEDFSKAFLAASGNGKKTFQFRIGSVDVEGKLESGNRGLMGIALNSGIDMLKMDYPSNVFSLAALTFDFSVVSTYSTLLGLYRILEGKLSFRKSISGPIKIMKIAADAIKFGWDRYWLVFAEITFVLGIMNLIPFPVLDGGHIVMYLIEGLYKPLPTKVIAAAMRVGVVMLIGLGIYVILLDIWDVYIKGTF